MIMFLIIIAIIVVYYGGRDPERRDGQASEGGMMRLGKPHRAQSSQFELFELKFINSSFSSLSSL